VWQDFRDLDAWLAATITAIRSGSAAAPAPTARPFFCGPEVWGPGRRNPPDPDAVPGA
jgi:hypothetical protein